MANPIQAWPMWYCSYHLWWLSHIFQCFSQTPYKATKSRDSSIRLVRNIHIELSTSFANQRVLKFIVGLWTMILEGMFCGLTNILSGDLEWVSISVNLQYSNARLNAANTRRTLQLYIALCFINNSWSCKFCLLRLNRYGLTGPNFKSPW